MNSVVTFAAAAGATTQMTGGPSGGESWVCFQARWALLLTPVRYPDGEADEADVAGRLRDRRTPSN